LKQIKISISILEKVSKSQLHKAKVTESVLHFIPTALRRLTVEYRGRGKAITKANRMELKTLQQVSSVPKGSRSTEEMRKMDRIATQTLFRGAIYCSYGLLS